MKERNLEEYDFTSFALQRVLLSFKSTIQECPCGCERPLNDMNEAHGQTISLIPDASCNETDDDGNEQEAVTV